VQINDEKPSYFMTAPKHRRNSVVGDLFKNTKIQG